MGDLPAVATVILSLKTMDSSHVERVSQDKLNPRINACVGKPVPIEGAFTADRQAMFERFDKLQEQDLAEYQDKCRILSRSRAKS